MLEAGHSDFRLDPFIHMPAALPIPIGSRFYDWRYYTEPEPEMGGRRVYHARGKVLGGSSSINGMIFQRGNPLDFQRWAADPGMESWDYLHCLPYFKRMETRLLEDGTSGANQWRGGDGPLILERGPATNPAVRGVLRGRPTGRLSAHRRCQRLPPGGLRAIRPQRPQGSPSVGGSRVPPPGLAPPQPEDRNPRTRHVDQVPGQASGRGGLPPSRQGATHGHRR